MSAKDARGHGSSDRDPRNAALVGLLRRMFAQQAVNRRHAARAARAARKLAASRRRRSS